MQRKILVAIILNVIIISATLGIISYLTINESIERSLKDRITLARIIADYLEVFLHNNLNRLFDVSLSGKVDLKDDDWEPERRALETAYRYSLFADGVFLLDRHGNELLVYPPRVASAGNLAYIPYVNQVLEKGRPVISNVYTIEPVKKQIIFMMTPLRDKGGDIVGIAGGMLNPTNPLINQLLQTINIEKDSYIEVIDSNEIVLASDTPARLLRHHDHGRVLGKMIQEGRAGIRECGHGYSHPDETEKHLDLLAFAPLKSAPWGVIVGQADDHVFAPATKLRRLSIGLILAFIASSVLFAVGASRRIVRPLKALIEETNRIANGDLSKPVGNVGSDEMLLLSKSFDVMRAELALSLDSIQKHNLELEQRVALRTRQIRESQLKVESLLKKIISSEEDERKRIARELHDEVLQDVSAFLINLDICKATGKSLNTERIDDMRDIVVKIIDDMHHIIQNLRPTTLDDLGLHAAIMWLVNRHLKEKGIAHFITIDHPGEMRFDPMIEITLFRIIQESITNIARHANAQNVFIALKTGHRSVSIDIEDDGDGFDVQEATKQSPTGIRGLGILGMKERAALLDGRLTICSTPGQGTRISVTVPLKIKAEEEEHV
ncbi:MAG: ATP-binding protein [Nitrospirota bacterium]